MELHEAVPEAVKNMLLVMAAQGVLRESGGGGDAELWSTTWKKAAAISPELTPAILQVGMRNRGLL